MTNDLIGYSFTTTEGHTITVIADDGWSPGYVSVEIDDGKTKRISVRPAGQMLRHRETHSADYPRPHPFSAAT